MPTLWDTICKVFVRDYPRAILRLFDPSLTFVRARPTELKAVDLHLDSLLEVISHGQPILLHVEFQTSNDSTMAERLLEYNVITRRQQKLPVLSCVLYLLPDGKVPASPLRWHVPGRPDVLVFAFESIHVSQLVPEDLIGLGNVELLTLLPLTRGGARQEMLEYMLQALRQHGDEDLEVIGFIFASLAVRKNEPTANWLRKRFNMTEDIFSDIPLIRDIEERGELRSLRQTLLIIIERRFPSLLAVAQQQAALMEDPHTLQEVILNLSLASKEEDARHALLSWRS